MNGHCIMKYSIISLLVCFIMAQSNLSYGQSSDFSTGESDDYSNLTVSILTAEGNLDLQSSLGHTTIRFKDDTKGVDFTINFGAYEFGNSNFYIDFFKRNLKYRFARKNWDSFIRLAQKEDRTLYEQTLNLDNQQKRKLVEKIQSYFEGNNEYTYDFFYTNCTTLIRDLIEEVYSGTIIYPDLYPTLSHRSSLEVVLANKLWTKYGLDLIIGIKGDGISIHDQMFLPLYYMHFLDGATVNGQKLVNRNIQLMTTSYKANPSFWDSPMRVTLLLLVLELVLFYLYFKGIVVKLIRIVDRTYFIILSILSLGLIGLWLFSPYDTWKDNWNIVWANPLIVWLAFATLSSISHITKGILVLELAVILFCLVGWNWIPQQFNSAFLPLFLILFVKYLRYLLPDFKAFFRNK